MADNGARRFFRHTDKPEWGVGVLVEERDAKRTIDFQHGKRHVIAQPFWDKLAEESPSAAAERAALDANESISRSLEPKKGRKTARTPAAPRLTFDQQVALFRDKFPGGYGEARKADLAAAGIGARDLLGAGYLAGAPPAEALARLKDVLQRSELLHPVELLQVTQAPEEKASAYVTAIREALWGAGDYAPRFDALVAAMPAEKPTWTMVTVLPALVAPGEHVFVKPGLFQTQARILGTPINGYNTTATGSVYVQFQGMARTLRDRLAAQGLAPADLLDVYTFVWRTLSPSVTKGMAVAVPAVVVEDD